MFSRLFGAWLVSFLLLLQGCATPQALPELPAALGEQGLLVARLYVLGMPAIENAGINIDGRLMGSSMRNGYVAVALDPGEHKLSQIRAQGQLLSSNTRADDASMTLVRGGGGGFIYIPGGSYTVHYTTLSVDRSFQIESGKVTNLGLIVYIPVTQDPDKKSATVNNSRQFNVVALDNNAEINSFLETNYPELVGSLKSREITLAPGKYLAADKLPNLRRAIAYHESRGPQVIHTANRSFVYGRAGTIVGLNRQAADSAAGIEVIDTGTLADMVGAVRTGDKATFLTSDGTLLEIDEGKVNRSTLPFRVQPVGLHALGNDGMVAVDNRMRILSLRAPGAAWISYEGAMIKGARSDIDIVSDDEGAYVALGRGGYSTALYYLKSGDSVPRQIATPDSQIKPSFSEMHFLVARQAGLFALFGKADFHFWSKSDQRWYGHSLPAGQCKPMRIDADGRHLQVECDGLSYQSDNSGASWAVAKT